MINLKKELEHDNPDVQCSCSLLTTIPCMFHGEMRISIKFIQMIFIEGHSNCVDGNLCPNISGLGPARFNQHMLDVENVINDETLGEIDNEAQ